MIDLSAFFLAPGFWLVKLSIHSCIGLSQASIWEEWRYHRWLRVLMISMLFGLHTFVFNMKIVAP
jgi:hypothetical protein